MLLASTPVTLPPTFPLTKSGLLFLHPMIWHEGYHHGQIKLALKLAGHPISDDHAGPITWRIWMRKTATL